MRTLRTRGITGRCAVPLIAFTLAFAGLVGVASADDTAVLGAIQTQGAKLAASPQVKKLQSISSVHSASQARKAEKPLREIDQRIRRAARIIERTSGSTAAGRTGKTEYVLALRKLAYGYGILYLAVKQYANGEHTTATATGHRAEKSVKAATKLLLEARKELAKAAA